MLLTLFKINRNKNIRNNPKAFTDAGVSDDMHFPACLSSTLLVYHHFRHHRQQSLAKMITVKGHTSLSNLSGPFFYESFTRYTRKGREQHYNVRVNADLRDVSTVQTTGAREGSSQNGTCARSATHWPWPRVLKYSYLLSMSLAWKQLFLLLWSINLCSPRWCQLVAALALPSRYKTTAELERQAPVRHSLLPPRDSDIY